MRTTLDIDDDELLAAKERTRRAKTSTGAALTRMVRDGLQRVAGTRRCGRTSPVGTTPLPSRGETITSEDVSRLRHELCI